MDFLFFDGRDYSLWNLILLLGLGEISEEIVKKSHAIFLVVKDDQEIIIIICD